MLSDSLGCSVAIQLIKASCISPLIKQLPSKDVSDFKSPPSLLSCADMGTGATRAWVQLGLLHPGGKLVDQEPVLFDLLNDFFPPSICDNIEKSQEICLKTHISGISGDAGRSGHVESR